MGKTAICISNAVEMQWYHAVQWRRKCIAVRRNKRVALLSA